MKIETKYISLLGYHRLTINGTDYLFWEEKQVNRIIRKLKSK